MPATFMGENITVLRPATADDTGFSPEAGEQVLVRMSDGTEKIIAKADIRDSDLPPLPMGKKKATRRSAKPRAPRKLVANARKQSVNASRYHRH